MKAQKTHSGRRREDSQRRGPRDQAGVPAKGPERIEEIRRELESRPLKSPLRGVQAMTCPFCEKPAMNWSDAPTLEWVDEGERIVVTNLTGMGGDACRGEALH